MKHIFIINPVAGKGKSLKLIPEIERYFANRHEELVIETTAYPGHATEIAAAFAQEDHCSIYSVGGDGTLNEVLNGMAGGRCRLGVIPGGSGNDFIKSITDHTGLQHAIRRTVEGTEKQIDLARVNGRYFLNIASVGFDALVVQNTIKFKKFPLITGKAAYILGILSSILSYINHPLEITLDHEKILQTTSLLTAVANGKFYGGGMKAAPEASVDDGLFDVCVVGRINRLQILRLLPRFIKGRHGELPQVSFHRGSCVKIKSSAPVLLNMDGEVQTVHEAVFELIPGGVTVIVPSDI